MFTVTEAGLNNYRTAMLYPCLKDLGCQLSGDN